MRSWSLPGYDQWKTTAPEPVDWLARQAADQAMWETYYEAHPEAVPWWWDEED